MYADERGLGETFLEQQARIEADLAAQRALATLRSGQFTTPQSLPEITVTASPLPFYILLAVILWFAFGQGGKGRQLW